MFTLNSAVDVNLIRNVLFFTVLENRLRELCEDLLGPVPRSNDESIQWQATVLVSLTLECYLQRGHYFKT